MKRGAKDVMVTVQKGGHAMIDFGRANGGLRMEGGSQDLQRLLRSYGGRPLSELAAAVQKGLKDFPGVTGGMPDLDT